MRRASKKCALLAGHCCLMQRRPCTGGSVKSGDQQPTGQCPKTAAQLVQHEPTPLLLRVVGKLKIHAVPRLYRGLVYVQFNPAYEELTQQQQTAVWLFVYWQLFVLVSLLFSGLVSWKVYWQYLHPYWLVFRLCWGSEAAADPSLGEEEFNQEGKEESSAWTKFLPFTMDQLLEKVLRKQMFTVLEGPAATGKTTLLKLLSRHMTEHGKSPIFIPVTGAPSDKGRADYVLWYVAQHLSTSYHSVDMRKAKWILQWLHWLDRPAVLIFDMETMATEVDTRQFAKHVKSFVADERLGHAVIGSSDANVIAMFSHNFRVNMFSAAELDKKRGVDFLKMLDPTVDVTEADIAIIPRTPLFLRDHFLPVAKKRDKAAMNEFVEREIQRVMENIDGVFFSCKERKKLLELAAKPEPSEVLLGDVVGLCGPKFDYYNKVVAERQLFHPTGSSSFKAQFDQTREAFRRAAAE